MKFCVSCGRKEGVEVEFTSPLSIRCVTCALEALEKKKERRVNYRNARLRALTRLSHKYPEDYQQFLAEEKAEEDEKFQRKETADDKVA